MEILYPSDIADVIGVDAKTIVNRYFQHVLYHTGRGRGGKVACFPAGIFEDYRYAKYIKTIDDSLLQSQIEWDSVSTLVTANVVQFPKNGASGDKGRDIETYEINGLKIAVCINGEWFVSPAKVGTIFGTKSVRDARKMAERKRWTYTNVPTSGGPSKYYSINNFDLQKQFDFRLEVSKHKENDPSIPQAGLYASAADSDRAIADKRAAMLHEWLVYRETSEAKSLADANAAFVEAWNLHNPDFQTSKPTLYRIYSEFLQHGVDGLLRKNHHPRAGARAPFHPQAKVLIESLFFQLTKPDLEDCYQKAAKICKVKGWALPSCSTVDRYLKDQPEDKWELLRNGRKTFYDGCFPSIGRDDSNILPGQYYTGDARIIDVSYGQGKRGQRLVMFGWADVKTSRMVSLAWSLTDASTDPHAVLESAYTAFLEHLPDGLIIDNGKDYKTAGHTYKNGDAEIPPALQAPFKQLFGENVHWAKIENARTKIIERIFASAAQKCDKMFPGYTGKDVLSRPDNWEIQVKRDELMTAEQIKTHVEKYFFEYYNNWKPRGKKSPNELWFDHFVNTAKKVVDPMRLKLILLPVLRNPSSGDGMYQVRADGIEFRGSWYWDNWMQLLPRDSRVYVKAMPTQETPEWILITDEKGKPHGMVPKNRFKGVPYLAASDEILRDFYESREGRRKEIEAERDGWQAIHGLDLSVLDKFDRADIGAPPQPEIDKETGEIIELTQYVELDVDIPPRLEDLNNRVRQLEEAKKQLENKIKTITDGQSRAQNPDYYDELDKVLAANG